METVTALFAELLGTLRAAIGSGPCPGGWAWAVTAIGVGVGLLPTVGAVGIAVARRRIGSRYGVVTSAALAGVGLVSAGLLPYLAFTATGRVFSLAASGGNPGLSGRQLRDLDQAVCLVGPQSTYLGEGTVVEAFDPTRPVALGMALLVLVPAPVLAGLFTAAQARLALRRGPRWPSKYFWLPVLALAFLTTANPAGTSAHLWLGVVTGSLAGIVVVLLVGPPSHETVRRSLEPGPPRSRSVSSQSQRPAPGAPGRTALADRLAERFAARAPEPPVVVHSTGGAVAPATGNPQGPAVPALRQDNHRPTMVGLPPTLVETTAVTGTPRFRLIRRLGDGGFGRVWLAHDARLGHTVALKAAHAPDHETEERIRREAAALAAVRHPNCVRIHDLVHAASDPGLADLDGMVIVMEYVQGSSLGEIVRTRGVLDDAAAARVWAAVAGALDAAHARGVLHRDVKPGNVVVDPSGIAHLIDFGIARRTGDATLTATGFVLGTPDFLAPEVAAGGRATPASDAWQLAATVSYALTGHPPRGDHEDALSGLRAAAAGAPLTHLPRRTAHLALLHAALDTDPGRRPPLAAVERALRDWLHRSGLQPTGPVTAMLPGPG